LVIFVLPPSDPKGRLCFKAGQAPLDIPLDLHRKKEQKENINTRSIVEKYKSEEGADARCLWDVAQT
jgi:hypothetical protein